MTSTGRVFYNYSVDGGKLYGLGENGEILRTTNLRRWNENSTLSRRRPHAASSSSTA